jgi:hypothetical protein
MALLCLIFIISNLQLVSLETNYFLPCDSIVARTGTNVQRYDCSNYNISWKLLNEEVNSRLHTSIQINLSSNKFHEESTTIKNYSFYKFEDLTDKLDLSSNKFVDIEPEAFAFYKPNIHGFTHLTMHTLDLSRNNFNRFPYESLVKLENLRNLYFGYNNNLEAFDGNETEHVFPALKYLHLNNCKIKYLNIKFLQKFNHLEYLNLNDNNLLTINKDFQLLSPLFLSIQSNPLNCSCDLLWLKRYLHTQSQSKGVLRSKDDVFSFENSPELYDSMTCELDYYEYYTNFTETSSNLTSKVTTIAALDENSEKFLTFINTSIVKLDDRQFLCPIQIINYKSSVSEFKMKLECLFKSYPEPHIWWLFGEKTINRDSRDHHKIEITNETLANSSLLFLKTVLSVSNPQEDDRGLYKCCASYDYAAALAETVQTSTVPTLSIPATLLVDLNTIFAQRLNQTVIQTVDIDYGHRVFTQNARVGVHIARVINKQESVLVSYLSKNKYTMFIISAIALILFVSLIVILVVVLSIRSRNRKIGKERTVKSPIYKNEDYSKNYAEIQQLKLRQHDGFEYDDSRQNYYKARSNVEYDDVSKDDEAISSICSKSSGTVPSSISNVESEEDLNMYEDPAMMINLHKPGQVNV